MSPSISIRINGEEFLDFKSANVQMDMEEFARSFSFEFSDKWIKNRLRQLPFAEEDPCEVFVHGTKVIDGFIDDVGITYGPRMHKLTVSGYAWPQDLVACSAVHKTGTWKNGTILTIAKDICQPFGVGVQVTDPTIIPQVSTPFPKWSIEDEETAFECVNRMAKTLGLFLMTNETRDLLVAKPSKVMFPSAIVYGPKGNVIEGQRNGRWRDRHSYYLVKSQTAGDDTWYGDQAGKGFYRENDDQVRRYRPLIIVSDGAGSKQELETRAKWERNTRAGRSRRLVYTLQGFRDPATLKLWPVNQLVRVEDPMVDTQDNLIIIGVNFSLGPTGGEKTVIEVGRAEAFDVLSPPPKPPKKKKGAWSLW